MAPAGDVHVGGWWQGCIELRRHIIGMRIAHNEGFVATCMQHVSFGFSIMCGSSLHCDSAAKAACFAQAHPAACQPRPASVSIDVPSIFDQPAVTANTAGCEADAVAFEEEQRRDFQEPSGTWAELPARLRMTVAVCEEQRHLSARARIAQLSETPPPPLLVTCAMLASQQVSR
jgi:hypothetical protein